MGGTGQPRRLTVKAMPAVLGLATAGHQNGIDEAALWKATNFGADTDGLLSKRPGLRAYGQTLLRPDADATGSTLTAFVSFLSGTSGFLTTDGTSGDISPSVSKGVLQVGVPNQGGTPPATTLSMAYSATAVSANAEWAFRFLARGSSLYAYNGTDTTPKTFHVRIQSATNKAAEFALFAGGLYYKAVTTGTYTLVAGTTLAGIGGWNTFEIRRDGSNVLVYLNDTLVDTIATSAMYTPTLTGTSLFEFRWGYNPGGGYTTYVTTPMYNDVADDPFVGDPVVALGEFQYDARTGGVRRVLMAACGNYIYHDANLTEVWRPLQTRRYAYTHFAPYRQSMVWTDYDGAGRSVLWQWDGIDAEPTELTDAPPVEIVVEHQGRLWGICDHKNPHRGYYSAYAQPNVWFSPSPTSTETFDTALDAGYIQIPAKGGDRITAVFGDYYGTVILWTRKTVSRVDGFGVFSYQHTFLNQRIGCEDQNAVAMVGNDLWFLSNQGIRSLVATQQFGDIQVQQPMLVLQNLWAPFGRSEYLINRNAMQRASMDMNPTSGLVTIAMPLFGDQTAQHMYVYNVNTQQTYGPWEQDFRSVKNIECLSPLREVIMVGDSNGQVGYFDHTVKSDYGAAYTGTLESAVIDGRSLDPALPSMVKTFKELRLQLLLRGHWDFTVRWVTYGKESGDYREQIVNQSALRKAYTVDRDMRVDVKPDGVVLSGEEVVNITVQLDARGQGLVFQIEDTEAGQDVVVHGWEVDLAPDGKEQE